MSMSMSVAVASRLRPYEIAGSVDGRFLVIPADAGIQ